MLPWQQCCCGVVMATRAMTTQVSNQHITMTMFTTIPPFSEWRVESGLCCLWNVYNEACLQGQGFLRTSLQDLHWKGNNLVKLWFTILSEFNLKKGLSIDWGNGRLSMADIRWTLDIRRTYGGHMVDIRRIYDGWSENIRRTYGKHTAHTRRT